MLGANVVGRNLQMIEERYRLSHGPGLVYYRVNTQTISAANDLLYNS